MTVSHRCASTGLLLEPSTSRQIWRIAKTSYGPLNPMRRPSCAETCRDWSRYDAAGHMTVYGAAPVEAAYGESIAFSRPSLSLLDTRLRELFDDKERYDLTTVIEQIKREWAEPAGRPSVGHVGPGKLAASWRQERLLYRLTLPATGWFINLETAESISAVVRGMQAQLAALGVSSLTTATLRSERRAVTTAIAGWLWTQVLDDGSLPHGIRYGSKLDSAWSCWAIWPRKLDDEAEDDSELTTADEGAEIQQPSHNLPLATVADLFGLRVF